MTRRIRTSRIPHVYCASSIVHAPMWREWVKELKPSITIVSTWHNSDSILLDDANESIARAGWRKDKEELSTADELLVYAAAGDHIEGTLVEIGMAVAMGLSIHLAGDYSWRSWRHLSFIAVHKTLHDALVDITKAKVSHHD